MANPSSDPNPGSSTGASTGPEAKLQVRRTITAPRERVYRAWTKQEELEQWMCRDVATHRVKYLELDVRAGGHYVMEVNDLATGDQYLGQGLFRQVTPPEKLVFTWAWRKRQRDGSEVPFHAETLVTVEFWERGSQTEVVLTHEFFKTAKEREETERGWEGCFDALASVLES
jgi:uncharacterized protein YndB with AHSA1/START domain